MAAARRKIIWLASWTFADDVFAVETNEDGQIRFTTRPLRACVGRLVDPEGDATVAYSQLVGSLYPRIMLASRLYWETEIDNGISARFHNTTSEQGGVVRLP